MQNVYFLTIRSISRRGRDMGHASELEKVKASNVAIFLAFLLVLWYIGPTITTMAATTTTVSQIYYNGKIEGGLDDAYERSGYMGNSKVIVAMSAIVGSIYHNTSKNAKKPAILDAFINPFPSTINILLSRQLRIMDEFSIYPCYWCMLLR